MARRQEMSIGKLYGGPNLEVDRFLKMYVCVPATIVANRYVVSTNMINGAYTIANSGLPGDSLAHNVTVAHTTVAAGTDTLGTLLVTGRDIKGLSITETITPVADNTVQGLKAFAKVESIVGSGWVIAGGNDTILMGFGEVLGMPDIIAATSDVVLVTISTGVINAPTVVVGAAVSQCTVLMVAGDATKKLRVLYQI